MHAVFSHGNQNERALAEWMDKLDENAALNG